jgi:hypothetical protein
LNALPGIGTLISFQIASAALLQSSSEGTRVHVDAKGRPPKWARLVVFTK